MQTNKSPFITATTARELRDMKSFDFSPWGGIEGFLKASKSGSIGDTIALKRLVPDLAHAVDMTATAISSLPFDILNEDDSVFDTSTQWQNLLGGMENPQRILYLIASSLCGGSAYVIPTRTPKMIFDLHYCAPHTITEWIDRNGLQWFDRATDQGEVERIYPNKMLYFWLPDSDIEIGPALNNPLDNAAMDASIVLAGKMTIRTYGERGYVPITVIGSKGPPPADQGERNRIEAFFDRLLKGGFDVVAKIVNSDMLSINRIGAGMDELKQSYLELRRDSKESIADAFGIPPALFMSDSAYASEMDAMLRKWYSDSRFVSIYQTIQETFSDQLFRQWGKKMRFAPETLDIFQADESARAASLGSFVSAVSTDPQTAKLGMEILGYDLTQEQEAALDKLISDKEAEKEKLDEQMESGEVDENGEPIEPKDEEETGGFVLEEDIAKAYREWRDNGHPTLYKTITNALPVTDLSAEEMKDLALWYTKAKAWFNKGKGAAVDWENKHLREDVAAPIRVKLAEAKNAFDIMSAFRLDSGKVINNRESDIKALVAVIEKAIEATKG